MIEKHAGIIVVWCDGRCNRMVDTGVRRNQYANLVLRENGWRTYPFDKHYCPSCSKKIPVILAADRAEGRIKQPWEKWR